MKMITLKQVIAMLCCCCLAWITVSTAMPETGAMDTTPDTTAEADSSLPTENMKITAEDAIVDVQPSGDRQYRCDYDENKYTVTTATNGDTFEITATGKPDAAFQWEDHVIICIPDQTYDLITGISEKSGLKLSGLNANLNVTNNSGSVTIDIPSDYDKTLNYTGASASGAALMNGVADFAASAKFTSCSVTVPDTWPPCGNGSSEYSYTSGSGMTKVNLELTNCSFSLNNK